MPTAASIRPAQAEDAEAIWALRIAAIRQGCRHHYPAALLAQWTAAPMPQGFAQRLVDQQFIVAQLAGQIVGFAGLQRQLQEVDAVFVDPDFGGQKIGHLLLTELETTALRLGLDSLSLKASLNAVPFYATAGYQSRGEGWHVTPGGGLQIACLHMQKLLPSGD